MYLLRTHPERLFFALSAALCCGLVLWQRDTEPFPDEELARSQGLVTKALSRDPTPAYPFHPRLTADRLRSLLPPQDRAEAALAPLASVSERVAYWRPSRPAVAPPAVPPDVRELFAVLGSVTNVTARAEPSRIVVEYVPPRQLQYMQLVSVEIYRSEKEDQAGVRCAAIQYAPEKTEEPAAAAATAVAPPAPATTPHHHVRPAHIPEPAPAVKPALPEARFVDTHVEPYKTYFYQLRAIGRMTAPANTQLALTGDDGKAVMAVYRPPKDAQSVQGAATPLYASRLGAPVAATAQANCEIRLAGLLGQLPPPDAVPQPVAPACRGTFAVRLWLLDAQVWTEATVQASVGERIKGYALVMNPVTKQRESLEFDTGYEVVEIKWGERTIGGATAAKNDPVPNEIAVLKNTFTGGLEEFAKRSAGPAKKE